MGLRYEILMPVYTTEMLHGGPTQFGLLMGASGIGAIFGSLILAMFSNVRTLGDWAALAAAGFGGSLVLLSFSHSFALSLLVMLLIGFTMVTGLDASNTLVQRIVPDELRGRVMAIWTMMLSGLAPFGSLVVGVLAQQFTARRTFAAGGMACIMGDTSKTGVRLLSASVVLSCCGGLRAQTRPPTSPGPKTPSTQSPSPAKTPSVAPSPNATPLPQSTPFVVPNAPGPSMTPAAT